MKIATKTLCHALEIASMVIEGRNPIPILATARFQSSAARTGIHVSTSNLDQFLAIELEQAIGDAVFDVALPAPARLERLLRIAGDEIDMTTSQSKDGKDTRTSVDIKGGGLAATILAWQGDDHPVYSLPAAADTFHATLGHDALDMILRVSGAMSADETRYYLNGVYLHHVDGWTYQAVATDGHRLYTGTIELPDAVNPIAKHGERSRGVSVPKSAIKLLRRLRPRIPADQPLRLMIGHGINGAANGTAKDLAMSGGATNAASFALNVSGIPVTLTTKLIDGTFPDYVRVIPQHNPDNHQIAFKRRDLAGALDAIGAGILERSKAVKLTFDPSGKLAVSAKWIDFSVDARVEIPASVSEQHREPFEIGYNGKYLRSLIEATTGEDLVINVADPGSPGSIVDPTADGFRAVLMPMRI